MLQAVSRWLVDPSGLTPHGFCLLWEPGLIWTYSMSDLAIGLAYFTIPLALAILSRRRADLVFRPVFWLFGAFILLCGTGHWLDLLTLWVPAYGADAVVHAATAIVSVASAVAVWLLLPRAVALPSAAELRAANAALRESEALHRANFDSSPVPLHTLDGDGHIIAVSRTWLALLGYQPAEVIGHHITEFGAPDAMDGDAADQARLMSYGAAHDMERRYLRRDGSLVDALVSARVERRLGTIWIVCVVIDVTDRKRAEAALQASEERLRQAQKMEAVGQLTGGIAHDFNNMLQGVKGSLELMERRIEQGHPDQALRFLEGARGSVDRAAGLTQRMLAFARRQTLQPRLIEPDALVRGMEELIRRTIGPAVALRLDLQDRDWAAECDANQLESALLNLAINARDAMADGGVLTLATARTLVPAAGLAAAEDVPPGEYVEISVADTGTGMPPDVLARAFEPFFTTKPIGLGSGLGLSQVYGFVHQSGGFVRLDSAAGAGTVVRLLLPRQQRSGNTALPADALPRRGATRAAVAGRTVLVVEDEADVRSLIVEALDDLGGTVLQAVDGPSGLAVIHSSASIDLLITDFGLPGLNGRQLADAARATRPGLGVLLVTGYAGGALDAADLPAGVEVMTKPFALDTLADRVCGMLEGAAVG
jgi:PAS domain S-box-containing protein